MKNRFSLWYLMLLLLPYTNFPLFKYLFGGGVDVMSLAAIPAGILLLLLLVQRRNYIRECTRLDIAVLSFIFVTILTTVAMSYYLSSFNVSIGKVEPYQRMLRGIVALCIGIIFYFVVRTMANSRERFKDVLLYGRLGFALPFAVSLTHVLYMATHLSVFRYGVDVFRVVFTTKTISAFPELASRVASLTLEPSWAADQILVFVLPVTLAVLREKLSYIEFSKKSNFLWLITSLVVMLFTLSRWGWIATVILILMYSALSKAEWMQKTAMSLTARVVFWTTEFAKILAIVGVFCMAIYVASFYIPTIAASFDSYSKYGTEFITHDTPAVRVGLWYAGWMTFLKFPIFGTGYGNTGFFVWDFLPSWAENFPEVVDNAFANPKNLLVRILSESGLVGITLFSIIIWQAFRASRICRNSEDIIVRIVGDACFFGVFAFLVEGVSIDSLAFPYLWVWLGLLAGTTRYELMGRRGVEVAAV